MGGNLVIASRESIESDGFEASPFSVRNPHQSSVIGGP